MEARLYYPCQVLLYGNSTFLIWYSDDQDGFVRTGIGRLVTAPDLEVLLAQSRAMNITFEQTEAAHFDFDAILSWCDRPDPVTVNCKTFLDAWNVLDDLAESDKSWSRLNRAADVCYDKLFWGNNLPAVTPPGYHFDPAWSPEELSVIRDILRTGIKRLARELQSSTGWRYRWDASRSALRNHSSPSAPPLGRARSLTSNR